MSIILVVLLLVVAIYPVLWLILSSLKTQNELTLNSAFSLPGSFNFENYIEAWTTGNMGSSFVNSVICTAGSMLLIVVIAVPFLLRAGENALEKQKTDQQLRPDGYDGSRTGGADPRCSPCTTRSDLQTQGSD